MATLFASKFADTCQRVPLAVRAIGVVALLVLAPVAARAGGDPIVVDTNPTPCVKPAAPHYTAIQDAVNAASAGTTIFICPGTYSEQITINLPMTLKGVTAPNTNNGAGAGAAIITAPSGGFATYVSYAGTSTQVAAQVLVQAPNVTLTNLAVDGTNAFSHCSSPKLVGIDFEAGSSGFAQRVAVTNQNVPNPAGGYCSVGIGILANLGSVKVVVRDSVIHNFDMSGIDGEGPVYVDTNLLTPVAGRNQALGILLNSPGPARSSVDSNTITDADVGIFCNSCSGATLSGNSISGTSSLGIFVADSNVTVNANTISFPALAGIFAAGSGDIVRNNYIAATAFGIFALPSNSEKIEGNTINDAQFGIEGATGNKVSGNTFLNVITLAQ